MKKDIRLDEIVKLCKERGTIHLKDLAKELRVSDVTARRDVKLLETLNIVRRKKSIIEIIDTPHIQYPPVYDVSTELNKNKEQKIKIAKEAVKLIEPGETVIFDSGSTLIYTANALPDNLPIKAVCYGLEIANILRKKNILQLIVLGGIYHKDTDMCESLNPECELRSIRAQKALISAFGVHKTAGLTSGNFFASSIRRKFIETSEESILLADSSKLGVIEYAHFADLREITTIITDTGIDEEYKKEFQRLGIRLIIV